MLNNLTDRIRGFDGLRAIAVIFVFIEHRTFNNNHFRFLVGVWLFFVLSGYLITNIMLKQRIRVETGTSSYVIELKKFFIRRSFRIIPPYFFVICGSIILFGSDTVSRDWIFYYITFTTNIGVEFWASDWPGMGHLWSLAVEEQFYLIVAPLFILAPLHKNRLVVFTLICLSIAALALLLATGMRADGIWADSVVNFGILGAGAALAVFNIRPANGQSSILTIIGLTGLLGVPSLSLISAPLIGMVWDQIIFHASVIFAVMCIYSVIVNQNSFIVKFLERSPIRSLGTLSYSFYLWHYPIKIAPFLTSIFGPSNFVKLLDFALEFGLVWCVAFLSYRLIERPFLRIRDDVINTLRGKTGGIPADAASA